MLICTAMLSLVGALQGGLAPDVQASLGPVTGHRFLTLATVVRVDQIADSPSTGEPRRRSAEAIPPPGSPGVVGYPTLGSAEKGQHIYDYLLSYVGQRLGPAG